MRTKIEITIHDVVDAQNSIAQAIEKYAQENECVASGICGPTFATSGPGSGWTREFTACDFAKYALSEAYGAASYVDSSDGREATLDEDGDLSWTDESVVCLICPDDEDALNNPAALAVMLADLETHSDEGAATEWKHLAQRIRAAAEAIEGIELPE